MPACSIFSLGRNFKHSDGVNLRGNDKGGALSETCAKGGAHVTKVGQFRIFLPKVGNAKKAGNITVILQLNQKVVISTNCQNLFCHICINPNKIYFLEVKYQIALGGAV
jgi:hypothetical protein